MESLSTLSAMMDPARDLTLEAAQAVGARFKMGTSTKSIPFAKLKALLDSRSDRDIIDGLRRVIAMIYLNKPALPYFSSVVKNVANPNIEVKKLVYVYLVHYAESDPDLALLSVNAIQKSLGDQSPQIRAMALRTMAGMRVPVISQIVFLAIKKGVADLSPVVRRSAVYAMPKCYELDPNTLPQLLDQLSVLLGDKQFAVAGAAMQVFQQLCPDRIDMLHKHYRSLVRKLIDMDEWGQLATIQILLLYARKCFPRRQHVNETKPERRKGKDFYDDDSEQEEDEPIPSEELDSDLKSLLDACQTLLVSRSSAIIVAAANCLINAGSVEHVQNTIGPLIALLRGPPEIQQVVLPNIVLVALSKPQALKSYTSHFLVSASDTPQIWRLKLELLTLIFQAAGPQSRSLILFELENLAHSSDPDQIKEAVQAIGRCAQCDVDSSSRCFKVLLDQITDFDNVLVSEVLTVVRHLIQRNPDAHRKTIVRLARNLDRTTSPEARATIIWLVGEYTSQDSDNDIAPDVLRILVKNFADESDEAKQQIVLLGAKLYLRLLLDNTQSNGDKPESDSAADEDHAAKLIDHPIRKIWSYLLTLVRYDTGFDLRDRTRMFRVLLSDPSSTQLASLVLFAPKPVPHIPSPSELRKDLTLGSTSLALGKESLSHHGLPGFAQIPEWVEAGSEPDPKLRTDLETSRAEYTSPVARLTSVAASQRLDEAIREQGLENTVRRVGPSGKSKTLDDWLEESESEDEDEEDEEESEEETGSEDGDQSSSAAGDSSTDEDEDDGEVDTEHADQSERRGLMST